MITITINVVVCEEARDRYFIVKTIDAREKKTHMYVVHCSHISRKLNANANIGLYLPEKGNISK